VEFVIISDDDGHSYVCPADRELEALQLFEEITNFWRDMPDADRDREPVEEPEIPEWLRPVGGAISRVKFKQFRIEE
jgi:hypothetical protein